MSLEDDIFIERFLKKELTSEEDVIFSKRFGSDTLFKEKVIFEKQLLETLNDENWNFLENEDLNEVEEYKKLFKSKEVQKIKKVIQAVGVNYSDKTRRKRLEKLWFSTAAAVVLLFFVYTFNFTKKTPEKLYNSYIELSELPSIINRSDNSKKQLTLAQMYFENKDYEKSLAIFYKIKNPNPITLIYKGISEIELHKFKAAETTFSTLFQSDFIDASKGEWYLALLYIKNNRLKKAKKTLKEIVKNKSFNYKKAQKLIDEL